MIQVSVIVPIYNKEKYLKKNIESLINQSLKEIEIILINDGSNDKSEEICKNYMLKDNRIIYKKTENKGVCSARNEGIKISQGKYCIFIDADDFIEKDMLKEMYSLSKKNKDKTIICGMNEIDEQKISSKKIPFKIKISEKKYNLNEMIKMNPVLFHSVGNKLFLKKILIEKEILFLNNFHGFEDLNFVFKYFLFSEENYILDKEYYNYYRNENSMTKKYNILGKEAFIKKNLDNISIFFDIKKFIEKHDKKDCIKELNYKLIRSDIFNSGYKDLQNFYIKNLEMKLFEFIESTRKYEKKVDKMFEIKIKKSLKIRAIVIIIFRRFINKVYKLFL